MDEPAVSPALERLEQEARQRLNRIRHLEQVAEDYMRRLHAFALKLPAPFQPVTLWRLRFRCWLQRLMGVRLGTLCSHAPRLLSVPRRYHRTTPPADSPVISIVTPSFNQGPYLQATLDSVLGQGYPRLEYVVQDGGSGDNSVAILQRYADRLTHWESAPDGGQTQAVNRGFRSTTGEIMAYLNADDLLLPGSLAYVARFFRERPDVDVVYAHRVIVDADGHEVGRWVLPRHDDRVLDWADYVPQETLFWRRRIWDRVGAALDESFRFAMDWDLLLRFRAAGARFVRLPRFLGAFRIHPQQKTQTLVDAGLEEMARLRTRCHGRPITWLEVNRGVARYFRRHAVYTRLYSLGLLRY